MSKTATFFYSDTNADADLRYLGGFQAPDPFLALVCGDKKIAVLSSLEIDRCRRTGSFDEVLDLEEVARRCGSENDPVARMLWLAGEYGADAICLPEDFPGKIAVDLRERTELPVWFVDRPVCDGRLCKSDAEAERIRRVNSVVSGAFSEVEARLGAAGIRGGELWLEGEPLTSERLRREIAHYCLERDCWSEGTIVAGGDQACDPHEHGGGVLPAHALIIVDIFPRDLESGYFGDMTRTYLKGRANPEQRKLVETVADAQRAALDRVRAGVGGREVHDTVCEVFARRDYRTGRDEEGFYGFFHGTGHGLGLQIHESPRVSKNGGELRAGMVTTIEPGLYYRGIGGCRIEDVVRVTAEGAEPLSEHSKEWEIP